MVNGIRLGVHRSKLSLPCSNRATSWTSRPKSSGAANGREEKRKEFIATTRHVLQGFIESVHSGTAEFQQRRGRDFLFRLIVPGNVVQVSMIKAALDDRTDLRRTLAIDPRDSWIEGGAVIVRVPEPPESG